MERTKPQYFAPRSDDNTYLTVGRLKKDIKDLPDDTPVFYHVIEDWYFDKGIKGLHQHNGWSDAHSSVFVPHGIAGPRKGDMYHYIRVWCSMLIKVFKNGRKGLVLTAHY